MPPGTSAQLGAEEPENATPVDLETVSVEAVTQAIFRERSRVSRRLHDEVGQALTAVALELDLLRLDEPRLGPRIFEIQQSLERAFEQVRDLTMDTHPDLPSRVGFDDALARLAARAKREYNGTLHVSLDPVGAEGAAATGLYAMLEEALDHVLKGQVARTVWLTASHGKTEIREEGSGFRLSQISGSPGGRLINFLGRLYGVHWTLMTIPGQGTILQFDLTKRNP